MNDMNLTAEEQLALLEGAAVAGEPVTPEELVTARERVTLSNLVARGAAARAEAERHVAAMEVRELAKVEAAKLFSGRDTETLAAFEASVSALEKLVAVIEAGAARLAQAELVLRQGGVPARGWDGSQGDGFDPANHASMEQGGTAAFVILGGEGHGGESAALWVAAAVHAVAIAHGGLLLPDGRGDLERRVRFDKPRQLQAATLA